MHPDQIAYQLDYLTTKRLKPIDTMNTMKTMMAVAALALATGSVQAKPQLKTVAPKTGTLIVYRPGEYVGIVRTYAFSIDGGPRHHINAGRYMRFELPAGDHIVAHPLTSR